MGATSAAVAAAIVVKRERDLIEHFRRAGALSAATARSSAEIGVREEFVWHRLRATNVVREVSPGMYYFDEVAWVERSARRRRTARMLLIVMLSVIVVGTILLMGIARH